MFYNSSLDDCENMKVVFANAAEKTELICADGSKVQLKSDEKSMEIDKINAFSVYTIVRKLKK